MADSKTSPLARLGFLTAEALVVFLGVWAAFMLDGCRERQVAEARRQQIHDTLRHDLIELDSQLVQARAWFDKNFIDAFLTPFEAGEQPFLRPIPLAATDGDQGWNAILGAGGLDVLDIELIQAVEAVLGTSRWIADNSREYNAYVRTVLVPELGAAPEAELFYDPESGKLRAKYLWYYHSIVATRDLFDRLQVEIKALRRLLDVPVTTVSAG
ncbi:MAG: hypothetical protein AAGC60_00865 [Acidobacteriota bacterium]